MLLFANAAAMSVVRQAELAQKDKLLQHISGAAGAAANPLPLPLRGMLQKKSTPNRRAGAGAECRTAAKAPNPTPPRFSKAAMQVCHAMQKNTD